jgi:hypothetical protein
VGYKILGCFEFSKSLFSIFENNVQEFNKSEKFKFDRPVRGWVDHWLDQLLSGSGPRRGRGGAQI